MRYPAAQRLFALQRGCWHGHDLMTAAAYMRNTWPKDWSKPQPYPTEFIRWQLDNMEPRTTLANAYRPRPMLQWEDASARPRPSCSRGPTPKSLATWRFRGGHGFSSTIDAPSVCWCLGSCGPRAGSGLALSLTACPMLILQAASAFVTTTARRRLSSAGSGKQHASCGYSNTKRVPGK